MAFGIRPAATQLYPTPEAMALVSVSGLVYADTRICSKEEHYERFHAFYASCSHWNRFRACLRFPDLRAYQNRSHGVCARSSRKVYNASPEREAGKHDSGGRRI